MREREEEGAETEDNGRARFSWWGGLGPSSLGVTKWETVKA